MCVTAEQPSQDSIGSPRISRIDMDSPTAIKKDAMRISAELVRESAELKKREEQGVNFINLTSRFNNRLYPINIDTQSKFQTDRQ